MCNRDRDDVDDLRDSMNVKIDEEIARLKERQQNLRDELSVRTNFTMALLVSIVNAVLLTLQWAKTADGRTCVIPAEGNALISLWCVSPTRQYATWMFMEWTSCVLFIVAWLHFYFFARHAMQEHLKDCVAIEVERMSAF